jgi:regulator of protease activity HflC (stomatin/prohibitin superfamily)
MIWLIIFIVLVVCVVLSTAYIVRQQHVAIVERLGKFDSIQGPGFHVKLPYCDKVFDVDLMTEDQHMTFDAKTSDNVTIELDISIQYHVDASDVDAGSASGIWKSRYTLTDPVMQMKDYLADALRSQIPNRTLDEVFSEKDAIAQSIDEAVATKMLNYGIVLVTTLITSIRLPAEVQESMNHIIASKNHLESATNDANAERAKTVIAAQARAEAMAAEGQGIADQRVAIARGIKESIDTIKGSELSEADANRLFEFTQWIDMMRGFASKGASTVVLPNDFQSSQSQFDQFLAARETPHPEQGQPGQGSQLTQETRPEQGYPTDGADKG